MEEDIEKIPLEERQRRAGAEMAQHIGEPGVLRIFNIMRKWGVESFIWPEGLGNATRSPR